MHPLWLFKGYYRDLQEAVNREVREFAYRHLAADLRGLLVDATPIGDVANRMFQLTVVFPTLPGVTSAGFTKRLGGAALNEFLLAGPPNVSAPPGGRADYLSRDTFLALPAVRLADGSAFTLRDVVVAAANLAGGVHSSARKADGERLQPLATALFGPGLVAGTELLVAVARCVLTAYKHLFTLTEGTSLGLAQPRREHQPLIRLDPARSHDGVAMEFTGVEFFEDGFPAGLSSPFVWIGLLALRIGRVGVTGSISPMADRCIMDLGPPAKSGPCFSILQRGRSILARFVTAKGEVVTTPPARLMDRRFYAIAAGVAETKEGQLRIFVHPRGGSGLRSVEAFGPLGIGMGTSVPSRITVGTGLDRREVKASGGALMQLKTMLFLQTASEPEIDICLENLWKNQSSRRWVTSSHPEMRVPMIYNQAQ